MANKLDIVVAVQDNATAGIRNINNSLNQFDTRIKKSTLGTNQFGAAVNDNTRFLSKFAKSGLQQTGYQVQDFFVQVGAGTSAIQAFGQQGSQLLGIFGPIGAILGAGVAILAAVGVAFDKAGGAAIDFNNSISDVKDTALELLVATDMMSQKLAKLRVDLAFQKIQKAVTTVNEDIATLTGNNSFLDKILNHVTGSYYAQIDAIKSLSATLGLAPDKVQKLVDIFKDLNTGALSTNEAFNAAKEGIAILNTSTKDQTEAFAKLFGSLIAVRDASLEVENAQKNMGKGAEYALDKINKTIEKQKTLFDEALSPSINNFFMEIFKGTKSAADAFKSMANAIISELFRILVVEQLVQSIGGALKSAFPSLAAPVKTAAFGGTVAGDKPVLIGERGPELFIPHTAGRITPNSDLGGTGVTVNQTINVTTGVQQTVRAEIANLMPQIANASKAAVAEARQRGGSYSKAMGTI